MQVSDDLLITPDLLRRFQLEASMDSGNGQHYALVRQSNGNLLAHHPGSPPIIAEQVIWAVDVLHALNKELDHDGAWVVVFTHPRLPDLATVIHAQPDHFTYDRYALIWLDEDGDCQFTVEWARGESELLDFADVMLAGLQSTLSKCEAAWELWHHHMRDVLEPKPDELIKKAQGQRPRVATRH